MASLFLSYSRKDIDFARKLTDAFKGQALDFWIDWEGIPPTVDWWKEIEKGIEEADIFLFLLSPDSAKSKVCRQEIGHAAKNGKRLIPVVIRDVNADEAPVEIKPLNWIFLRENDNFSESFGKLMAAIKTDYEWVQTHRQLQVKALEWKRSNHENSFLLRGKELQDAEFQLATNSSKQPYPTDLQREYVLRSRLDTDKRRRITSSISITGVIALTMLSVFGFRQSRLATERANIALARQLAAQAQSVLTHGNSQQTISVLLAVRSMELFPSVEAAEILQLFVRQFPPMNHEDSIKSVAFSPDGRYVVSGSYDDTARVWDATTGKEVARMTHDGDVTSVAISPDGNYVVTSGSWGDGTARLWKIATGKEIARTTHASYALSVAFSPDSKYLVSGGCDKLSTNGICIDGTTRVWDIFTGKEIGLMTCAGRVSTVAFSSNSKYVISGCWDDGTVLVWETLTGKEVVRTSQGGNVNSVAFSPNGKYFVSGGCDMAEANMCSQGSAHVWEAITGKEVAHLKHDGEVFIVAFSPDSKYLVSGSGDNTARVWEIKSGKEVARMTHDGSVTSVTFSPDGKYIASGSNDNTARVWEAATGNEVARMIHDYVVSSIAFSPDGKYAVSGSWDKTVRIWIWQTKDLIANACAYLPRNLSRAEWRQYIGIASPYEAVCPNLPLEPVTITRTPTPSISITPNSTSTPSPFAPNEMP